MDGIVSLLALGPRSIANIKDLDCNRGNNDGLVPYKLNYFYFFFNFSDFNSLHLAQITLSLNLTMQEPVVNTTKTTTEASVVNTTGLNSVTEDVRDKKITMTYILWIGLNESSVRSINVTTDPGINFYYVMQLAAQQDENFA